MGVQDSSRTRVAPVFDRLFAIDPTGETWLPQLLGLVDAPAPSTTLVEARWWPTEKCLFPPQGLLAWLAQNLQEPADPKTWGKNPETVEKRRRLIARDPEVVREALVGLRAKPRPSGWYVL